MMFKVEREGKLNAELLYEKIQDKDAFQILHGAIKN